MITEVSIILAGPDTPDPALRAYASILIADWFRVSDMRVICVREKFFVSCPARQQHVHCGGCRRKHSLLDRFCPKCGRRNEHPPDEANRPLRFDMAHPIAADGRVAMEAAIVTAYHAECAVPRNGLPGQGEYAIHWKKWPDIEAQVTFLRYRPFSAHQDA